MADNEMVSQKVVFQLDIAMVDRTQKIILPINASVLRFGFHCHRPYLIYSYIIGESRTETRNFRIISNGQMIFRHAQYISTEFEGNTAWHLFEV